jgi:hypothetical protein
MLILIFPARLAPTGPFAPLTVVQGFIRLESNRDECTHWD